MDPGLSVLVILLLLACKGRQPLKIQADLIFGLYGVIANV